MDMVFADSLNNFEEAYCGEWSSEEELSPIRSKLLRCRPAIVEECYNFQLIDRMGDNQMMDSTQLLVDNGRELFMYERLLD